MIEKSKIPGVFAGIICWWIDKDVTMFLPIKLLRSMYGRGWKSVSSDFSGVDFNYYPIVVAGKKKRVFFDYDMEKLLNDITGGGYGKI